MWDLPGPGLEPVSPALAGGFLTIAPPGKPACFDFDWDCDDSTCQFAESYHLNDVEFSNPWTWFISLLI